MGFFYWGRGKPANPSAHELAHERAGRGEGLKGARWWRDNGQDRIQHDVPYGRDGARRAAIVVAAGYLQTNDQGFEDAENDRREVRQLAKEARVSVAEIEAAARKYVR